MTDNQPRPTPTSPMLRRIMQITGASANAKRWRLPRRGRIRALLLLGMIGAGIFFVRTLSHGSHQQPRSVASHDVLIPAKPSAPDKKSKSLLHWLSPKPIQKTSYNADEISALLRKSTPSFERGTDTLDADQKRIVVHYSIDSALQRFGTSLIKQYHPKYSALVAMDPRSGRVLSLISYTNEGESSLGENLACRALFPAASIFKTVTAAAAIEKANLARYSLVRQVGANHTLYKSQLVAEPRYSHEIPLSEAFAKSINPVFGRLGVFLLGKKGLDDYAERFGFEQQIPFDLVADTCRAPVSDSVFALAQTASGFNQRTRMSPLLGAMMVSAVIENGNMPRPILVDSITNATGGEPLYRAQSSIWRTPIKPHTADELKDMMFDVARYGTARKGFRLIKQTNLFDEAEYGGKTGNVNMDSTGRVDWFIGFARHPAHPEMRIAVGVVTVHGEFWTVHSSYLGAEMMRVYFRDLQTAGIRNNADPRSARAKISGSQKPG